MLKNYNLYVSERKGGNEPVNALDYSIGQVRGGYNIFTSQDAYKGLTNEEVAKKSEINLKTGISTN